MQKIINTSIFIILLATIPTTNQTFSFSDSWTHQEVKNVILYAAVFTTLFIIYKKLPFTPQLPEFTFEQADDDTKKDENNPKVPVEVEVVVTNDDISECNDTDYDDTDRKQKTVNTKE